MQFASTSIVVFVVAAAVTWLLIFSALYVKLGLPLDRPNARSLHSIPTPRFGGTAVMLGVAVAILLAPQRAALWPFFGAVILAVVSFMDDLRSLPMTMRLVVHLVVASLFVTKGFHAPLDAVSTVATILAIVWMTNLFNFMDGSDGLAGGMAFFGFGFYFIGFSRAGEPQLAFLSGAICAASIAFLWFNKHPARVFMGDGGSIPLGFLAGALGMYGWATNSWPLSFPLLVFSPFIVDATLTLLRRVMGGEKFWQPHRDHSYQRLVRMGYGHRSVARVHYLLMLLSGLSATLGIGSSSLQDVVVFGLVLGTQLALFYWTAWRWKQSQAPERPAI